MSDETRSEQACPVCGNHTLALDEPPRIDIMGVQLYSDIVGMGDLKTGGAVGIVCLTCGTRWADRAAFDRGDPDPPLEDAVDDGSDDDVEALANDEGEVDADADADADEGVADMPGAER